ncbi:MAG: PepSY-associated TM helix domain-containing protein [Salinibacter sp.]
MKEHLLSGTTRTILVKIHLWLSFAVGAVFIVAAGTGAILAFDHEIDTYLNRDVTYPVTEGDVGFKTVADSLRSAYPNMELAGIWFPRWNKPYYEGAMVGEDGAWNMHVVDPGTGRLIEPSGEKSAFTDVVKNLHVTLLGGDIGWWVVVVTTGLSIVILVTGVFLWWPKLRHTFDVLTVRGRSGYLFNYDLHQVSGILAFLPLLAMCVTGVFLAFPKAGNAIIHAAFLESPSDVQAWNEVEQPPPPDGWTEADRLPPEYFLEKAHEEVPGAKTFYIMYPLDEDEVFHVRLQTGIEPKPFGITSRLAFDQYTGDLLQVIDPRRMSLPNQLNTYWVHRLHFGDFGGAASKMLYLLACIVGVVSTITGFIIWWMKRQRKQKGKQKVADRKRDEREERSERRKTSPVSTDLPGAGANR